MDDCHPITSFILRFNAKRSIQASQCEINQASRNMLIELKDSGNSFQLVGIPSIKDPNGKYIVVRIDKALQGDCFGFAITFSNSSIITK